MKRDLERDLARSDGIVHRNQLLDLGYRPSAIRYAVRVGRLLTIRREWLAAPDAPAPAIRAIKLGGRLGGASALASYGVWVDETELIVAVSPHASRLPPLAPGEHRIALTDSCVRLDQRQWRVSLEDALLQHARLESDLSVIASLDSAMHLHLLDRAQVSAVVRLMPERLHHIDRELDGAAMSGTESKFRVACVRAGLRVEIQVKISRVGYVDALIDGWLIVEIDSRKHHDGQLPQHRDRVRDGHSVLEGYGHERFDYDLVQHHLDWCIQVVLARLASGRPSQAA